MSPKVLRRSRPVGQRIHHGELGAVTAALDVLGFVLQLTGLLLGGLGLRRTWQEFRRPDEGFLDPLRAVGRAVERGAAKVWAATLRRIGLGRPPWTCAGAGLAMGAAGALTARGRANYTELPADATTEAALRELDRRTRDIMNRLADLSDRQADDAADIRTAIAALGKQLETQIGRLAEQDRRVAIGGIRLGALGLLLAAGGLLIQWVAGLEWLARAIA